MFKGSCLCGAIAYRVDLEPQPMGHCHCRTCRKAHSAAFSTVMAVPKDAFKWTQGEDQLGGYESSPGKIRHFCTRCGSQLVATRDDRVLIRAGSIDTEIDTRPALHIWRSDAANWYDPKDELPELPKGFPG